MWFALVATIAACLAIAYAAYQLASYSWDQVVNYHSPYLRVLPIESPAEGPVISAPPYHVPAELEASASARPVTRHLVIVIVDGMRNDVSRSVMTNLNTLRGYGGDFVLTVPQPSLSFPNWSTILSGAQPEISGVTTNWYSGRVLAPTLMDVARAQDLTVAVVGPTDFAKLYGVTGGPGVSLRPWPGGGFLTPKLVDDAIRIFTAENPSLMLVHLPDLDNAGHEFGGGSARYRDTAKRIDLQLQRLVSDLPPNTTFLITADHGHLDRGGHGGWEPVAVQVPMVLIGTGASLQAGEGRLTQVAPTAAVLLGMPAPPFATDTALSDALTAPAKAFLGDAAHHAAWNRHYIEVIGQPEPSRDASTGAVEVAASKARAEREAHDRDARLPYAADVALLALVAIAAVFLASWRAGIAALAGAAAYYAVYNFLYFVLHGYLWSLSAFNKDTQVRAFMNGRLAEAFFAAVVGAAVAAFVYPYLRESPKGPRVHGYLPGWLELGPATALFAQATLGLQVAWFLWWYGAAVTWRLPNLMWGFKYDLDLVQMTALGVAAVLAPLVTYVVGRYHPRVRATEHGPQGPPPARA